jgi:hypothetical protein
LACEQWHNHASDGHALACKLFVFTVLLKQHDLHDQKTRTQDLLEGGSCLDGLRARAWHALVAECTLVAVLGKQAYIAHLQVYKQHSITKHDYLESLANISA